MSHFKMPLEEIVPSQTLLAQMAEHLLQIQAAVCEIRIGRWVRNGSQIRSQMRLYAECHFCNSMIDLDIFLLQICAAFLDPDYLLDAILERFGIKHWFHFGPLNVPTPSCFDMDTDMSMVEGALCLILNLLSSRLHLGLSHQEVIRQEMVALLCIGDRTHSQLVELIPDKPGQTHKIQEFEESLAEIAVYKAPAFENGWMQQGKYAPKDIVWEQKFDPVQVFHRAMQRQDIQSAMNRYSAFISKTTQASSSSNLWPPFKPLRPLPKGSEGILRMLQCKTMHGMLYYIFFQAAQENSNISDSLLYTAVHLTSLALETPVPPPSKGLKPNIILDMECEDVGCQIASRCIDHLETYGKHVKDLHQVEDLRHINAELITTLQKDPDTPIDPQRFTCHDVCVVMACAVHQIMQPPLFDPFLPFMAQVLNSALNNKSNQNEKVAQLQHIQFLLELLPPHRRNLVKKLSSHLVSVSERFNIPTKNLVLVSDDSQPMELSMLLMYLIKYHDWMFRVHSPPLGWPGDILDLDFKSVSMVDSIRHSVGVILPPEPMDTTRAETASEGSTSVPSQVPGTSSSSRPLSQFLDDTPAFRTLVQEFMAITEAPESVARSLLITCGGNLELAINMHLNMEDTLPVLPDNSSQSSSTERPVHEESAGSKEEVQPKALNESILSILWKIKTSFASSSSSSSSVGDGSYYINKLIEQARTSTPGNAAVVASLTSAVSKDVEEEKSAGDDLDEAARTALRRKQARERQQKLLAEFASKQKSFMEQALKRDPDALDDVSMDVDAPPDTSETNNDKTYECVICGEASPSTEERPVGLVTLLQPSAVLKHRSLRKQNTSASNEPFQATNCGGFVKTRFNALIKLFPKDESIDALSAGCEGGIHAQTCGHYLHVDCQQSYLKSLQEEEAAQLHHTQSFSPRNGDFTCPLCRQLSNCVLPEIPLLIMPSQGNQKHMGHIDCLHLQRETLRKYFQNSFTKLTASALNFSVLGASIKTVVEIASMLGTNGEIPKSERPFELLYRTIRTNLELEQVNREARKLSTSRKSCFGSLMRAFHFHCQTLVEPLIPVWSELSDIDIPQEHSKSANNKPPAVPLLLRDAPSLLIQMMLSWTSALSLRDFQCLVQLIYNLVFTQGLVHSCCKFVGDERLSWQETGKKALVQKNTQKSLTIDMLLGFVTQTLSSSKLFKEDNLMLGISQSVWSPHMVEQSIRDFCLPYLKIANLISSLCYDTVMPKVETSDQEFQAYAASLQLCTESPSSRDGFSCADCLKWPHAKPLSIIRKWCDSLSSVTRRYDAFVKSQDLLPITHQWQSPKMIQLPERYDLVIQHYRKLKCTTCDTKPDDPAVCLVCGRFVCLQGMCCVSTDEGRKHECVKHSAECGAGTGVFLIVLSSVVIIIRADRVCMWGSVYLDGFGEEDRDLRRGKPLFLSQDRYNRLQEQWFTHSFDHTCKRWKRHMNAL
ncbi:E3 ubiquitin-protein ligase UBR3-like [Actinia tenebrosa]|uniref:E3 ubiquitin-protein ligase n=1 Tax=Actinia tenebrosa TaxID=6105 RepID=A0A6P8I4P0_ACTTE|nr:E3 ubiquitin-protein ligase UBR3-like [Actinia tenebrosa]